MTKFICYLLLFLISGLTVLKSQEEPEAEVYLITCGPGTDTYSIYGHSALRIIIPGNNSDIVYNWGVFDFSTPNFAWKFAKGRLMYMLVAYPFSSFLEEYFLEERWVEAQKLNLEPDEIERLFLLITENLKPENVKYRYDFFYDNCSTRIRDIIEKSVGNKLLYPPQETGKLPSFSDKIGEYQKPYPWLELGIDLLMGSPGNKKASFRDRMFLPLELQKGLSEAVINRNGKRVPLLQNSITILDFDPLVIKHNFLLSPFFIFSILLIIIIILTALLRGKTANIIMDLIIFTVFSVLALLMIFFNFFTDHQQLRWNLNIIWLSPFILFCFVALFLKSDTTMWFRLTFFLAAGFLAFHLIIFPQRVNEAFIPLMLILVLRSSVRANFKWNPLTLHYLTQF